MTIFGSTEFANVIKVNQGQMVIDLLYSKCKLFAWLKKSTNWVGSTQEIKWKIGVGGGGGTTFVGAKNNQSVPIYRKPVISRASMYQLGEIDHEEAEASRNKEGAAAQLSLEALQSAMKNFGRRIGFQLWSDKGSARAQISSVSTNILTLTDRRATTYFELNQVLQGSATAGLTGSLYTGSTYVTKIDESAGTITVNDATAINIGTGLAADDYLFAYDTFGTGLNGVPAWTPPTAPSPGESFHGVDRSEHVARMAGSRMTADEDIRSSFITFCGRLDQAGGEPDAVWCNPERHADLVKELDATTEIEIKVGGKANGGGPTWSFSAPSFMTSSGKALPIIADRYCPYQYAWFLARDSLELRTLNAAPHYAREEGRILRTVENADASQFRLRLWGDLINNNPHNCGVLNLGA